MIISYFCINLIFIMSDASSSKENYYLAYHLNGVKKFQCQLCNRTVNSKRSILNHLFNLHGFSPLKPSKKLYRLDEKCNVPKSTLYRWNMKKCNKVLTFQEQQVEDCIVLSSNNAIYSSDSDFNNTNDKENELSGFETDSSVSSDDRCISSTDSFSVISSESEEENSEIQSEEAKNSALLLLNCFRKHNLTTSACHDLLKTMRHVLPEVKDNPLLHYGKLLAHTPTFNYKEFQYCNSCEYILSGDRQSLQCGNENCTGLLKSFILADVKGLLNNLLKAPGILEDILKTKGKLEKYNSSEEITDIHKGELYKEHFHELSLNLSEGTIQLTAILNTDGISLYSSSRVELWPVFLAINELNPILRFSRENILLIGLWQGKGKPPFKKYFGCISEELNSLSQTGLEIETEEGLVRVYLTTIGITLDLPAKAGVLNMTQYNGAEACITCEEPGIVVSQGKGHCRCYPYRCMDSRFPTRSSDDVLQCMTRASVKRRQKGFKGISGLVHLAKFNLVYGVVPDYMHCVLLGIVKTIMCKWFSPTESGKEYFVGKQLKSISSRLLKIKPPHFIERLPRDLEKHYANFKATELQTFLLYFALPCLNNIQQERFLQHFALLSEAIYLLLGDNITGRCIERSEYLLDKFYSQFSDMYGEGSCGINVHNACLHIPMYVRKLGPLWSWSCFAFEDANAMILKSVHGTGDVVKQALRKQEIAMFIRSSNEIEAVVNKKLKVTHKAQNCDIIGTLKPVGHNLPSNIMEFLGVEKRMDVKRVERIIVNGDKFYSADYSRMKRRNCHTVNYSGDKFGLVQFYVLNVRSNVVYAVIKELDLNPHSWLSTYEAGKHLKPVFKSNSFCCVLPENFKATVILIDTETENEAIVVNVPNSLGHAVFK